jgi:hypothetical protein
MVVTIVFEVAEIVVTFTLPGVLGGTANKSVFVTSPFEFFMTLGVGVGEGEEEGAAEVVATGVAVGDIDGFGVLEGLCE